MAASTSASPSMFAACPMRRAAPMPSHPRSRPAASAQVRGRREPAARHLSSHPSESMRVRAANTASRIWMRLRGPIWLGPSAWRMRSAKRTALSDGVPEPNRSIIGVDGSMQSTTRRPGATRRRIGMESAPFDSNMTITSSGFSVRATWVAMPCMLFDLPPPGSPSRATPP